MSSNHSLVGSAGKSHAKRNISLCSGCLNGGAFWGEGEIWAKMETRGTRLSRH